MPEDYRLGYIGIMIEDMDSVEQVNAILHEQNDIVVARMGIPYRDRGVAIISLVVDGTNDAISAMTGALGRVPGVSVKSMLQKNK
ncbi:MAG: iron-only hydrogenase system regulator [Clostridia bacterium]|nr:iron-only hydrogenase system regulator [Clostridia bacterium]